ncbi:MAG: TlpA family protein disulfide reductase [Gemmatimonadetes bacterium]|nr:TlpA family protein disulfide reductase [Gemmatimonadota bacterium]
MAMIKLGLCCGGGLCCVLLGGALWLGGGTTVFGEATERVVAKTGGCAKAGCTKAGCDKHGAEKAPCAMSGGDVQDVDLTADEKKVVAYIADKIEDGGLPMIDDGELAERVGLSKEAIEQLDESNLRVGVMAELSRRNFDLASLGGNCSKYNACSVDRNLMNAAGEELERYKAEVALDGTTFSDQVAPDFTLPDTEGRQVSLSQYRGKNVAVVFLSAHCYHSLDTLPILAELRQKYERDLTILPVFINSGDVEDVASRAWELDVEYPLVVSEGKEISNTYDSRMVPSTFLIDEQGNLIRKFVGFKDKATLDEAFGELIDS